MVKVGSLAPAFSLPAGNGTDISLKDFRGKKVVLYFYSADDTQTCTEQACSFRDHWKEISSRRAVVLGISPDGIESHRKFSAKFRLNFTLLADEKRFVVKQYGVWGTKLMFGRKVTGVRRTTFLIDEKGRVEKIYERLRGMEKHVQQVVKDLEWST
jgi:peroxiredoxin Q/BCP